MGSVLGGAGSVACGGEGRTGPRPPGMGGGHPRELGSFSERCGEPKAGQHHDFSGFKRPFCPDMMRQQHGRVTAGSEDTGGGCSPGWGQLRQRAESSPASERSFRGRGEEGSLGNCCPAAEGRVGGQSASTKLCQG